MKIFTSILVFLALALIVFNITLLDFSHLFEGESAVALIGIVASFCAIFILLIFRMSKMIEERTKEPGMDIWKKSLQNIGPSVEVKSKRIGGANFQIPTEIRAERRISIGMKWLIRFSRERSGKGIAEKLAAELIAASKGEGAAVKRKEDTHRMAEANRAFAHFKA